MDKPKLYLFVGYPGAGKTTLAKLIAERTGAVHIWADLERKTMFGEPAHSPPENKQLYDHLNRVADDLLGQGHSVIFDTNFNFYKDREHLRQIAAKNGAETRLIWMATPKEVARERAVNGPENGPTRLFGNMEAEVFERIASHLQEPGENENVIKIDGTELDPEEAISLLGL